MNGFLNDAVWPAIVAAGVATFLLRTAPVLLLARTRLPQLLQQWLAFVPPAIMAAIVAAGIAGAQAMTTWGVSVAVFAAAAAFLAGLATRSLFATVIAGVACYLVVKGLWGA